jgi:hypothetical protein
VTSLPKMMIAPRQRLRAAERHRLRADPVVAVNMFMRDMVTNKMTATTDIVVTDVGDNEIDVRVQSRDSRTFAEYTIASAFDRRWRKRIDSGGADFSGLQYSWGVPERLDVGTNWNIVTNFAKKAFR